MFAITDHVALIVASATPALITGSLGLVILKRQRKVSVAVAQINTAVNHQEASQPTLIQRVIQLEHHRKIAERTAANHVVWIDAALSTIAQQVGCSIPNAPHPEQRTYTDDQV
jgi:hypothetical protein